MSKQEKKATISAIQILSTNSEKCFLHPEFLAALVSSGKLTKDGVYTAECTFTMIKENTVLVIEQDVNSAGRNMVSTLIGALKSGKSPDDALEDLLGNFSDASAKLHGRELTGDELDDFEKTYGPDDKSCDCKLCEDDEKKDASELH